MLTLDLVAEEDGFSPDYDDDSQESWENSFRVDLQRGDVCGQVTLVGSRGVGGRQRAGTDVSKLRVISKEAKVKTGSLPRGSERSWGKQSHLEPSKAHKTQQVNLLGSVCLYTLGSFGFIRPHYISQQVWVSIDWFDKPNKSIIVNKFNLKNV